MPGPPDRQRRRPPSREDLPAEFTPETLRHLDLGLLRRLARPDNGVLTAAEQQQFDAALDEVRRSTTSVVERSLERARRDEPAHLDPAMRRSWARAQQRLAEQARRARSGFPALGTEYPGRSADADPVDPRPGPADPSATDQTATDQTATDQTATDQTATDQTAADAISPVALEREVEQTSDTLDLLERIASLQQQQVEHQHTQWLSETRGLFFAFLVSVAVIVAGVAPLVEAEPHERWLILGWTAAVTAVAGLVYALVRATQARRPPDPGAGTSADE